MDSYKDGPFEPIAETEGELRLNLCAMVRYVSATCQGNENRCIGDALQLYPLPCFVCADTDCGLADCGHCRELAQRMDEDVGNRAVR